MPAWIAPQLATLVEQAPDDPGWLHEVKFDGYRILARVRAGAVQLFSRNHVDWTARLPSLARALAALPVRQAWVDGELVIHRDDGTTSFQELQNMMRDGREDQASYCAFDLLHHDGDDLRATPLLERKLRLERVLAGQKGRIRYSSHVAGGGVRFHGEACRLGLEGIVSKRAGASHHAGRTRDWLKIKCGAREEFVVVGWSEPEGSRSGFGALLLATRAAAGGELAYAGRVGTGFSAASLQDVARRLRTLARTKPPVANPPRGAEGRGVHWVEPSLVAEVAFTGWTDDLRLRHPSFQGLREDKSAEEIVRETRTRQTAKAAKTAMMAVTAKAAKAKTAAADAAVADTVAGVRLTHPDKVLWPEQGITKRELAEYFERIAPRMLPHALRRPLMLQRCPEGRGKACFYQKHVMPGSPRAIDAVEIREEGGKQEMYMAVHDAAGLVSLAQIGALEVHGWMATTDRLEHPDRVVFDLDPGPGVAWDEVVAAARAVRKVLAGVGLESFVLTSGGKGLHVVVPLARAQGWDEVKEFARSVATALAQHDPGRYVATAAKAIRKNRIFIDWLRNGRGATAVIPYSPRSREGAPVATPIGWNELGRVRAADRFDMRANLERLRRKDPWAEFTTLRQRLPG